MLPIFPFVISSLAAAAEACSPDIKGEDQRGCYSPPPKPPAVAPGLLSRSVTTDELAAACRAAGLTRVWTRSCDRGYFDPEQGELDALPNDGSWVPWGYNTYDGRVGIVTQARMLSGFRADDALQMAVEKYGMQSMSSPCSDSNEFRRCASGKQLLRVGDRYLTFEVFVKEWRGRPYDSLIQYQWSDQTTDIAKAEAKRVADQAARSKAANGL